MKQHLTHPLNVRWARSADLALVARLCEKWNAERLYEVFWEYARLNARVLRQRGASSWLCFEDQRLSGFALGRGVEGAFVLEEAWAPFEGTFGGSTAISGRDQARADAFRLQVLAGIKERPLLMRGAIDNHFVHGIARTLKLPWFNGLVLAERALSTAKAVTVPPGFALRPFKFGDEEFFSSLYSEVYQEQVSHKAFKDWAKKQSCRTIVATRVTGSFVGFIIAEKRHYGSVGDFAIAVTPRFQRMGVGGALLDAGLNALRELGATRAIADYRTSNGATHALYGGRGFKPVRVYNFFSVG